MDRIGNVGSVVRERLGEILLRKGRLDHHELARALEDAQTRGVRLGTHLVESTSVYEEDVSSALAEQFGLRYVLIDERQLGPELALLLPEETARRLNALPLSIGDGHARIAIADPSDVLLADELRMVIPAVVDYVVGDPSAIRSGIDSLYASAGLRTVTDGGPSQNPADGPSAIDIVEEAAYAPAVEEVNRLLRRAIELGASDIHFVPRRSDLHVRARVDGVMRDVSVIPSSLSASVIARLKVMGLLDIAERRLPQDGRVSISTAGVDMDLRVAVLPSAYGEEVVLRIAYIGQHGLRTVQDLGFDDQTLSSLRRSLRKPGGATIVAGPTGSGKTTTLYAAIEELNDGSRTIVSIEDPVESLIDGIVQVEVKPRAGLTFARGLRTILRADPDVILVGEIRDLETAEIALSAAMTGHVVLTTVHAQSAAAAIVRLREIGIAEASLGSAIRCILSQRLLRRPCPRCGQGEQLGADDLARVGIFSSVMLYRPSGCVECDFTGYAGRVGIYEALMIDGPVRDALGGTAAAIEEAAAENGSPVLYEQARRLCEAGGTTVDELMRVLGECD